MVELGIRHGSPEWGWDWEIGLEMGLGWRWSPDPTMKILILLQIITCPTYDHSDFILLSILAQLESLIDDDVHEWIESTENSLDAAASIQLERQLLVHVPANINKTREMKTFSLQIDFNSLFQLWWMCFRHFRGWVMNEKRLKYLIKAESGSDRLISWRYLWMPLDFTGLWQHFFLFFVRRVARWARCVFNEIHLDRKKVNNNWKIPSLIKLGWFNQQFEA